MKNIEILPKDIWNDDKLNKINEFVRKHSDNQPKERKIRNKLLSIQYKLEDISGRLKPIDFQLFIF